MKTKLLIVGGSSLLGLNFAFLARENYDVVLLLHKKKIRLAHIKSIYLDNYSLPNMQSIINEINPNIVINTTGMTNVEDCEKNPTEAFNINVNVAEYLAKICLLKKIQYVHISTDHITSGDKKFSTEEEQTIPKNVYAKTKILAEKAIEEINKEALIIRTNFFCWGTSFKESFSDRIISTLRKNKTIELFEDVYFTPIIVSNLFSVIEILYKKNISGLYNVVSKERINKYKFGLLICECFNLESSLIKKGKLINRKDLTNRPYDMSLSTKKLLKINKNCLMTIKDQIKLLKKTEINTVNYLMKI